MSARNGDGLLQALRVVPVIETRETVHYAIRRSDDPQRSDGRTPFGELGDDEFTHLDRAGRELQPEVRLGVLSMPAVLLEAEGIHDGTHGAGESGTDEVQVE